MTFCITALRLRSISRRIIFSSAYFRRAILHANDVVVNDSEVKFLIISARLTASINAQFAPLPSVVGMLNDALLRGFTIVNDCVPENGISE